MRIGSCEINLEQRHVRKEEATVSLSPRGWDVLEQLIKYRGKLVTTETLLAECWQGRSTNENYVRKSISEIRRVLGDNARSQSYVKTIAKQGYSLAIDPELPVALSGEKSAPDIIAVLPFANFSDDPNLSHFCDGLTEEVLTKLSHHLHAPVVARTSSFQFKDRNLDIREIGRSLGANHILEGSARTDIGLIRITAQLIDAITGLHIWSETYDCSLTTDILTQDNIADAIVARTCGSHESSGTPAGTVIYSKTFERQEDFKRLRDAITERRKHIPG